MTFLSLGIGCGLAFLILSRVVSIVIAKRRCLAEAARLGCEPAPAAPKLGFLGLTTILKYLKAMREERGPQEIVDFLNGVGTFGQVHTARVEGDSHSAGIERALNFDIDSVGLGNTDDPGPGECEGNIRNPCLKF